MLEIFVLLSLINSIKQKVNARGRRAGGFIAMTIILWVIPESIGYVIGYTLFGDNPVIILLGLGCGGVGGLLAYIISINCRKGDYVSKEAEIIQRFSELYEPLQAGCRININRLKAVAGSAVAYEMLLNGNSVGLVNNGCTLSAMTDQRKNVLVAKNNGFETPPFVFEVPDGGVVDISFQAGKFIPQSSTGLINYGPAVTINPAKAIPRGVTMSDNSSPSQPPAYTTGYAAPGFVPAPGFMTSPVTAPEPEQSPYAPPAQSAAPAPFAAPEQSPFAPPSQSPFAPPAQQPFAPAQSPYAPPAPSPYAPPAQQPFAAPAQSSFVPPAQQSFVVPAQIPYAAPVQTPYAVPSPYQQPAYAEPSYYPANVATQRPYTPPAKKAPPVPAKPLAPLPDDPTPVGDATPIHYVKPEEPKPEPFRPVAPTAATIGANIGFTGGMAYQPVAPAPAKPDNLAYESPVEAGFTTPVAPIVYSDDSNEGPNFCEMCGNRLYKGARFCAKCGAKLEG